MPNLKLLKEVMDDSGMTKVTIAKRAGIERVTLYNRLAGSGEFTASEIIGLSKALHMTKALRDQIFLT